MTTVYLANVRRLRGGSPVLYRREYRAELVDGGGDGERRFPVEFTLEKNPLGGWKVYLGELDTSCSVGQDRLVAMIDKMESDRKLP